MGRYKRSMRAYILAKETHRRRKKKSRILSIEEILNGGLNKVRFNTKSSWRNQVYIVKGMFKNFSVRQTWF